jgi:hypothetical protein
MMTIQGIAGTMSKNPPIQPQPLRAERPRGRSESSILARPRSEFSRSSVLGFCRVLKVTCIALLLVFTPAVVVAGADGPTPPCGISASSLTYPPIGVPPTIEIWHGTDLERAGWRPPACSGWPHLSRSKLVLAFAGSFRFDGTVDALLTRIGAVSTLSDTLYWSITDQAWRPLSVGTAALSRPDASSRRPDFTAAEMAVGRELFYWQNDSRSGEIVYRMQVLERSAGRAVIATDNLTSVRFFMIPLFAPGALQSVEYIEQLSPARWGVYILLRTGEGTSWFADSHPGSYVNRAVAVFRHLAGIPTDQEPPAAR